MKQYILLLFIVISYFGQAQNNEYTVKALYIQKFIDFTDWPDETSNFTIAVLGKNSIKHALEEINMHGTDKNNKVQVKLISNINEIGNAQVLYISPSKDKILSEIIDKTKDKPILTIGDSKKSIEAGVHFVFYITNNNTLHFNANPSAIKRSGLKTDAHLLHYAQIVNK